ncbi:MAG: ABC transporter permease [Acidimicrobiales bacterium]
MPTTTAPETPPSRRQGTSAATTVVKPRRSVIEHLRGVWSYRELLLGMVRKELKVKYKNSALGFVWSMLNPAMYLVVFYVVFQVVLGSGIPYFPIFLLSGLLAWNLWSVSLGGATGSIVGNSSLINKVYFPREILPLASVGANLVHFFLQGIVLILGLIVFRFEVDLAYLWLAVPALLVLLLLTSAIGIFLACANVYARDTQHLLELALLAWFWMTPIVYQWALPASKLAENGLPTTLALLNPMTSIVLAFQRAFYGILYLPEDRGGGQILPDASSLWYFRNLAIVGAAALVLFVLAVRLFDRLEANFAEEL